MKKRKNAAISDLETCEFNDAFFDYTMRPYMPLTPPEGKLSSYAFFRLVSRALFPSDEWAKLVDAIRSVLGKHRTVWGIKQMEGRFAVELYFYFNALTSQNVAEASLQHIAPITHAEVYEALRPIFQIEPAFPLHGRAIMMSVDVDETLFKSKRLDCFHLYIEGGLSYDVKTTGIALANVYHFFELSEIERVEAMLKTLSAHRLFASFAADGFQDILLPELYHCRTICLAAKKHSDAVYFAGLDGEAFRFFLKRFGYPESLLDLFDEHEKRLNHLRWDVGLDFSYSSGRLQIDKTGFYGTF